jgi:hypothetical protein
LTFTKGRSSKKIFFFYLLVPDTPVSCIIRRHQKPQIKWLFVNWAAKLFIWAAKKKFFWAAAFVNWAAGFIFFGQLNS